MPRWLGFFCVRKPDPLKREREKIQLTSRGNKTALQVGQGEMTKNSILCVVSVVNAKKISFEALQSLFPCSVVVFVIRVRNVFFFQHVRIQ